MVAEGSHGRREKAPSQPNEEGGCKPYAPVRDGWEEQGSIRAHESQAKGCGLVKVVNAFCVIQIHIGPLSLSSTRDATRHS